MQENFFKTFAVSMFLGALVCVFAAPSSTSAAVWSSPFEVSGWIPYWRTATGTADVLPNLNKVQEINPFVYTLKSDGTLLDNGKLDQEPWKSFIVEARKKNVRIIPTVMTSNGELVHTLLSNQKTRIALEDHITAVVKEKGFDGIDIDFEGKKAETRDYFSTFLKGLYMRMGNKWVMCTVEARTPAEDRFVEIPKDLEFANDFPSLNKYCDRVRFMTYDQQSVDLTLNNAHVNELYAPVSDPAWVEKALRLAMKDIKKSKIVMGIPTYGYEYDVTAYANGYTYDLLWSFNPGYALPIARQYGITPTRNSYGEMFFTYIATTSQTTSAIPNSANVGAAASSLAQLTNTNHTFRMMVWNDAQAVQEKIALAKKLGIRGVAIFKFDGGQDPGIWGILPVRDNLVR